jgi:hypothetical protein
MGNQRSVMVALASKCPPGEVPLLHHKRFGVEVVSKRDDRKQKNQGAG